MILPSHSELCVDYKLTYCFIYLYIYSVFVYVCDAEVTWLTPGVYNKTRLNLLTVFGVLYLFQSCWRLFYFCRLTFYLMSVLWHHPASRRQRWAVQSRWVDFTSFNLLYWHDLYWSCHQTIRTKSRIGHIIIFYWATVSNKMK